MSQQIVNSIGEFIDSVKSEIATGGGVRHTTEHSFRPALKKLLESISVDIQALNEPKRQKVGAPDFIIFRNNLQVAFLEAKDITEKLNDKKFGNQLDRYQTLGNLCFTNNFDWHFFDGNVLVGEVNIAKIDVDGKIEIFEEKFILLANYLQEFVTRQSVTIKTSEQLAKIMAKKTRTMKEILSNVLKVDEQNNDKSVIYGEYETFKNILIHDLTLDKFADIYAQTISYGLFTARYYDDSLKTFSRQEAANNLPKSNPFLRKLFQNIAGYELDSRLAWVVDNLVEVFIHSDVKELMHNFGLLIKVDDPILHFYETFLSEYDPKARKSYGVYYTPDPVVKFIVKSVDEILQNDFGLPMGLADSSKIEQKISKEEAFATDKSKTIVKTKANNHKEIFKQFHKVQILDPATGTGTFLLEVFNQIYAKFGNNLGVWESYAQNDLIPRIHGFEILMASYTMVHLKLAMFLSEKNVEIKDRLSVYLTNSLEEPKDQGYDLFSKWLTEEAREASAVKNEAPVMVVIGNPPYSISSTNSGEWINNLIKVYKQNLNEKKINLDDDYIKFIRYGQHYIEKNGEGILAYISNNSFIDGVTHRQMRRNLMETFDDIYILDLHGNSKKKETALDGSKDENVFDIQQGVSINIFVKTGKKPKDDLAKVKHASLQGLRKNKYDFLASNSIKTVGWQELQPDSKYHFFVPKDFGEQKKWEEGVKVSELFKVISSGFTTERDDLTIKFSKNDIDNLIQDFKYLEKSHLVQKYSLRDSRDWTINSAIDDIKSNFPRLQSTKVNYRPFDTRYTFYSGKARKFIGTPSFPTMKHLLNDNISLITCKQQSTYNFAHIFISKMLVDRCVVSSASKETGYVIPLYLYTEDKYIKEDIFSINSTQDVTPMPNFDPVIVDIIEQKLGMTLDWSCPLRVSLHPDKTSLNNNQTQFSPTDLLDYIYAVLHSPSYRLKYKEFLKIDFPRIPFDVDKSRFWDLVETGGVLRKLHLMEDIDQKDIKTGYPISGDNVVEKIKFENGKVWINENQYFENVSEIDWNFYIGGYQPAQKWLKDRKGRELTFEDIMHYQKIVYVLGETDRVMKGVD